ncbi:MAG: hypothetical protein ACC645_09675 [Pirellulales bacterium]
MSTMSLGRGALREVIWQDLCPWLILLKTCRLAISFRMLVLAAFALIATTAGYRVVGSLFSGTDDDQVQSWIELRSVWPWKLGIDVPLEPVNDEVRTAAPRPNAIESVIGQIPMVGHWLLRGPVSHVWLRLADPFVQLFRPDLNPVRLAYVLLCCLWSTLVWALLGGALTRVAALWLVRGETLGPLAALRYATQRWPSFFFAPLVPLGGALLFGIPLVLLGICMRVDALVPLAGFVWPLVLVAGLLLAILVVGLLVAWPLLWPGVSVEESDAFIAVSRGYAYAFQRPLHYLFYLLVASVLGIATMLVVDVFATSLLDLSRLFVSWGSGAERFRQVGIPTSQVEQSALLAAGVWLIGLWTNCVFTLQLAFQFGFFWSAATAIYLLLRRDVDATEMDEISVEDDESAPGLASLGETSP